MQAVASLKICTTIVLLFSIAYKVLAKKNRGIISYDTEEQTNF